MTSNYYNLLTNNKTYDKLLTSIKTITEISDYFEKYFQYLNIPYYPENHPKFYEMVKVLGADCEILNS